MAGADTRLALPEVTLVCVDTRTPALALAAMQQCLRQIRFGDALLFTVPMKVGAPPPEIHLRGVRVGSAAALAEFMLRGLSQHVFTRHALVVQRDGFVLDAGCWDPDFLLYDYIGAPLRGQSPERTVGSGGFSLRSRRLLQALRDPALTVSAPEDLCICHQHRDWLAQRHDIVFAPPELAARFAHGQLPPGGPTFGFHGLCHLHRVLSPEALDTLIAGLPDVLIASPDARDLGTTLVALGRIDTAATLLDRRHRLGLDDDEALRLRLLAARQRLQQPLSAP